MLRQGAAATYISGLTVTPTTGTFTLANGKVFTVLKTLTLDGTDGSTLNVGAGGTLGSAAFQPTSAFNAPLAPTAVKTGAYNAVVDDLIPVDTTAGNVTITLPTAPVDKSQIGIKHVIRGGTNIVTFACGGADVLNKAGGPTSATLTLVNQMVTLQYYATGAIWYVVSDDLTYSTLLATAQTWSAVQTMASPSFTTPVLGTPSSGTLTSCTGLPAAGVIGTAAILGANTYTATQTINPAVNTNGITVSGFSLTGSSTGQVGQFTGTLNTSGVTDFFQIAATVTAAGAGSNVLNVLGGSGGATSLLAIDKDGILNAVTTATNGANFTSSNASNVLRLLNTAATNVANTSILTLSALTTTQSRAMFNITAAFTGNTDATRSATVQFNVASAGALVIPLTLLTGKVQFSLNNSTGAGTALLSTNCPASTVSAPYTWINVISSDGSSCYFPVWK